MYTSAWALPEHWLFSNYQSAWELGVSGFFKNSVIITVLTVIVTVTVSSLAAYALSRFQYIGRDLFLFIVATGFMFSPQVSLIPLYGLIQDLGIYNTYWSLVLPYAAFRMPIIILLIRAFFLGIPRDYAESAFIDGCTSWGVFRKIYLPISRPIMFTGVLLTAYFAWNEFMFANIFIDDESLKPITSGLFVFKDALRTDWGPLIAGLTISALPLVILFIFIQKQFVRGLAEGGLKG
ncbi:carbohydrate ABC transporter permease [Paenibacillus alginolyticus]|uniref:carbohydrate ABC transporter permease n=1 Tax=Paenibacillus alginolyticus TaxID=59839 RepID=UPI002DB58492|nr:carbohydrate ABC transporter permease [Paenibacillus alginolyticus]MEC0146003.1 carbohydrate ABC transporter permease [Paenibacillus alginolyticus]